MDQIEWDKGKRVIYSFTELLFILKRNLKNLEKDKLVKCIQVSIIAKVEV